MLDADFNKRKRERFLCCALCIVAVARLWAGHSAKGTDAFKQCNVSI